MAIFVKTGGPDDGINLPSAGAFLTYLDMVQQISDELDDSNDCYLPQIENAIFTAIRFCAREPFYFNRNDTVMFNLKAGQACYDATDNAALTRLGCVSAVYCEEDRKSFALRHETAENLQHFRETNKITGLPCLYSFFTDKICLYPVPDKVYRLKLLLNPGRLPDIQAINEKNPWFTEAFGLIKARAKYDLYKDLLKDAASAAAAFNDFREEWAVLMAETSRRATSGHHRLKITQF